MAHPAPFSHLAASMLYCCTDVLNASTIMAKKRSTNAKKKKSPPFDLSSLSQGEVWGLILILLGVVTLLAMLSPRQVR